MQFQIIISGKADDDRMYHHLSSNIQDVIDIFGDEGAATILVDSTRSDHDLPDVIARLKKAPTEPKYFLNDNVSEVCAIESAVVACKNIGNKYTHTVDGFPVDIDENRGVYILHAEVFNKVPDGWDKIEEHLDYEEKQLTPWLESMGFKVDRWVDGERDSFGPLSRVGLLKRGRQKFEFIYG